jgi:hypothetical protein
MNSTNFSLDLQKLPELQKREMSIYHLVQLLEKEYNSAFKESLWKQLSFKCFWNGNEIFLMMWGAKLEKLFGGHATLFESSNQSLVLFNKNMMFISCLVEELPANLLSKLFARKILPFKVP